MIPLIGILLVVLVLIAVQLVTGWRAIVHARGFNYKSIHHLHLAEQQASVMLDELRRACDASGGFDAPVHPLRTLWLDAEELHLRIKQFQDTHELYERL